MTEYRVVYMDENGGIQKFEDTTNKDLAQDIFGKWSSLESDYLEGDIVQLIEDGDLIQEHTYA